MRLQQSAPDAVLAARCPLPPRHFQALEADRALVAHGDGLGDVHASALPQATAYQASGWIPWLHLASGLVSRSVS